MFKIKIFTLHLKIEALKFTMWILGMAGFSFLMSCTKYGAPVAEYGVWFSYYNVNFHGRVVSQDSLKPIPNIDVKIYSEFGDTIFNKTDASGNYSASRLSYENQDISIAFSDKDSVWNGQFLSKNEDVTISFRDINNLEHQADVQLQRKP
jgi:putative lipoprotein (rSAM/lipoprotein system)